jgi:hypothetical protein
LACPIIRTMSHVYSRNWNGHRKSLPCAIVGAMKKRSPTGGMMSGREGVWQHFKHVELRNLCCTDLDHLRAELNLVIRRLCSKPDLIQSFFSGAHLEALVPFNSKRMG